MTRPPTGSKATTPIYVATKTPFMSVVRRARKQLAARRRRPGRGQAAAASLAARVAAAVTGETGDTEDGEAAASDDGGGGGPEVLVIGTGRAIEKTVHIAAWFDRQPDCRVSVRTGTLGAVDDLVVPDGGPRGGADAHGQLS